MKKQIKIIIGAGIAILILAALILVVTLLPDSSDDENTSSYKDTSVTLLSKVPSDIKSMTIKNEYGEFTILSETPTSTVVNSETGEEQTVTQNTIYTLVGFEDIELASGQPDMIATDAAAVKALDTVKKTVSDGAENYNKADFGLENPVAACTVVFNDGETHTIYVGNNIVGDSETYFMFDEKEEIFVGSTSSFDGFLLNVLSLFNTTVVEAAASDEDAIVNKFVLSGTAFKDTADSIEFLPITDKTSSLSYQIVSPVNMAANNVSSTKIANSVLNLIASEVVYVNPDDKALEEYGLLTPYSKLTVTYNKNEITLMASEPDEEGNCYLLNKDKKLIYKISSEKLPWVTVKYNDFMPETLISPYLSKVDSVTVNIKDKEYKFDTETTIKVEDNVEKETTVVKIGDKTLDITNFRVYFQNITSVGYKGESDNNSKGDSLITITISYNVEGKKDDVIEYYATDSATKVNVIYQGVNTTYNFMNYVNKIIEDTQKMADNGTITPVV